MDVLRMLENLADTLPGANKNHAQPDPEDASQEHRDPCLLLHSLITTIGVVGFPVAHKSGTPDGTALYEQQEPQSEHKDQYVQSEGEKCGEEAVGESGELEEGKIGELEEREQYGSTATTTKPEPIDLATDFEGTLDSISVYVPEQLPELGQQHEQPVAQDKNGGCVGEEVEAGELEEGEEYEPTQATANLESAHDPESQYISEQHSESHDFSHQKLAYQPNGQAHPPETDVDSTRMCRACREYWTAQYYSGQYAQQEHAEAPTFEGVVANDLTENSIQNSMVGCVAGDGESSEPTGEFAQTISTTTTSSAASTPQATASAETTPPQKKRNRKNKKKNKASQPPQLQQQQRQQQQQQRQGRGNRAARRHWIDYDAPQEQGTTSRHNDDDMPAFMMLDMYMDVDGGREEQQDGSVAMQASTTGTSTPVVITRPTAACGGRREVVQYDDVDDAAVSSGNNVIFGVRRVEADREKQGEDEGVENQPPKKKLKLSEASPSDTTTSMQIVPVGAKKDDADGASVVDVDVSDGCKDRTVNGGLEDEVGDSALTSKKGSPTADMDIDAQSSNAAVDGYGYGYDWHGYAYEEGDEHGAEGQAQFADADFDGRGGDKESSRNQQAKWDYAAFGNRGGYWTADAGEAEYWAWEMDRRQREY
ncbi:hypothetical protein HK102_013646 [Quaeritorhiza haematococci]|nr:hypothetical protein HK102_013646 [Quaeritorhiza haematococci]